MNTANLQLEGLLLGMASLFRLLREKGLLSSAEIAGCLDAAMEMADQDTTRNYITPANQNAIRFPIDFLRRAALADENQQFSALAAEVGRSTSSKG